VPRHRFAPGRPHWWQWATVLSLDAPAVALVWQAQFARTAHTSPGWAEAWVLGVSTWLAYAADRWFEGWRLAVGRIRTQRHHFYHRWRWPILGAWVVLGVSDVSVAWVRLPRAELLAGALLLGPVLLYLLSHQLLHRDRLWRVPKEICVAVLIAGGAAVFVLGANPPAWRLLLAPAGLFALACLTNCALISAWEYEIDAIHGQRSLARQHGRHHPLIRALPWVLAVVAALFAAGGQPATRTPALALVGSGLLLGLIDLAESWLGWQLARVLADAALLAPLALSFAR